MTLKATPKAFFWLTFTIIALVAVLVGGSALWLRQVARDLTAQATQTQTMRTSQGVALAVIDDLVLHDYGAVETTLKRAFSNSGLLELTVYDLSGRVISSVTRDPRQDVIKAHFNRDVIGLPQGLDQKFEVVGNECRHWLPVNAGTSLGWLYVVMQDQTGDILTLVGNQTLHLAIFVAAIVLAVFVFVLHRAYGIIMQAELNLVQENEQLGDQLTQDPLTGLLNRTGLTDRLIRELNRQRQLFTNGLTVCFLDMDGFKQINDQFGHPVGDEVLRVIGRRIRSTIKSTDAASRFGGDEFVIVLNHISTETEVDAVLNRLQHVVDQPIDVDTRLLNVRFSIGVALYPRDGVDASTLLARADKAMYQSKNQGLGRWVYWRH